jgi:hypothetical protein
MQRLMARLNLKSVVMIPHMLLVAGLTLLVLNPQSHAQVSFAPAATYNVGSQPYSVTAADVNGDGKVDLICANYGDNTLSVLTNNGSGGFVLSSTLDVGTPPWWARPYSVTAADVNGDGKVDLICANFGNNTLSVLTNDGSGGFVLASTLDVGDDPISVTAADVNGDGKVDLICANYYSPSSPSYNTLTVLTNDGSGGFVIASAPVVGLYPQSVTAADVNGDGTADLVCANWGYNTLSVLTNAGSGDFVLSSTLNVGVQPISVTTADVNGDGKVDLICANHGTNTLSVLTNDGSGGFVLASSPVVGRLPYSITAADVNGDGKVDLICANLGDGTLSVLTNDGSGVFVLASSPVVGRAPISVTTADVNGDGRPSLICANSSDNTLSVLFNTSPFGPGAIATATALVTNGFVVAATITDAGGYDYTNVQVVQIVGGGGSGAQATATVSNGIVTAIIILNAGYGYTGVPSVIISPPFVSPPSLGIVPASRLGFKSLAVGGSYQLQVSQLGTWGNLGSPFVAATNSYSQYVDGTVSSSLYRLVVLPFPSQAAATPELAYGFVVGATVTSGGSGYVSVPAVNIVGGDGIGAQATATVSNGAVTAINIVNAGFGYTSTPTIQIDPPPISALLPDITNAVRLDYSGLMISLNYQLQVSPNLAGWTNFGAGFTATAGTNLQYLDAEMGSEFFRLSKP